MAFNDRIKDRKERKVPFLSVSIQPSLGQRFKDACAFKDIKPNDVLVITIKKFTFKVEKEQGILR